ncbi:MAG: transglutaminase domain-containing protein [Chloroflexi bacterium]|nr:MAG: transglutaminase domain-containing protein [Chloroflexota bacterium]
MPLDYLVRFIAFFIRRLGVSTFLSLLLLSAILGSVAWTLAEVLRGPEPTLLFLLAGLGLVLGWRLAAFPWLTGGLAAFTAAAVGVELVWVRVGRLEDELLSVVRPLPRLVWQVWRWPLAGTPDIRPAVEAAGQLGQAAAVLWARLAAWLTSLGGDTAFDPVAATLAWGAVMWVVSVWAGWATRRYRQPLLAVVPAGGLLAVVLAYALSHTGALLVVLASTLLLMGLTSAHHREQSWLARRVDFSRDIRLDLAFAVLAVSLGLTAVAGAAPSLSITNIARRVQETFRAGPVVNSLGIQRRYDPANLPDRLRAPGLPRRHLLGSGPELSERVVMQIAVDGPRARYYWRGATYDTYTGYGWLTGKTTPQTVPPGEPLVQADLPARRLVRQTVEVVGSTGSLLYAAGEPVAVDQPVTVNRRSHDDLFGGRVDAPLYRVDSLVPVASEAELDRATGGYPDWVARRYLRLPATIPDRVLTLARDLTAVEATPYRRARAIESYLRRIPYSLDLPEPPLRRDVVDYFLFDLRRGYCDYYATAMVVLARAAGLPARLAVGYVSNRYDEATGRYIVTEAEGHSWPEIYFSGYGWIPFEPTGGRPPLDRPVQAVQTGERPAAPLVASGPDWGSWPVRLLAGLVLLAAVGGAGWQVVDLWRLYRAGPDEAIRRIYARIFRRGRQLGVPVFPGMTPYEFGRALEDRLVDLPVGARWRRWLASSPRRARRLVGLYVRTVYSPYPPGQSARRRAIRLWRRLRWQLWLAQAVRWMRKAEG